MGVPQITMTAAIVLGVTHAWRPGLFPNKAAVNWDLKYLVIASSVLCLQTHIHISPHFMDALKE